MEKRKLNVDTESVVRAVKYIREKDNGLLGIIMENMQEAVERGNLNEMTEIAELISTHLNTRHNEEGITSIMNASLFNLNGDICRELFICTCIAYCESYNGSIIDDGMMRTYVNISNMLYDDLEEEGKCNRFANYVCSCVGKGTQDDYTDVDNDDLFEVEGKVAVNTEMRIKVTETEAVIKDLSNAIRALGNGSVITLSMKAGRGSLEEAEQLGNTIADIFNSSEEAVDVKDLYDNDDDVVDELIKYNALSAIVGRHKEHGIYGMKLTDHDIEQANKQRESLLNMGINVDDRLKDIAMDISKTLGLNIDRESLEEAFDEMFNIGK